MSDISKWPSRTDDQRVPYEERIVAGSIKADGGEEEQGPIHFNEHKVEIASNVPGKQDGPITIKSALKGSSHSFEYTPSLSTKISQSHVHPPLSLSTPGIKKDDVSTSEQDDSLPPSHPLELINPELEDVKQKNSSLVAEIAELRNNESSSSHQENRSVSTKTTELISSQSQTDPQYNEIKKPASEPDSNRPLQQEDQKKLRMALPTSEQLRSDPLSNTHDNPYDDEHAHTDLAPSYVRHPLNPDGTPNSDIILDMHGEVMRDNSKKSASSDACTIS